MSFRSICLNFKLLSCVLLLGALLMVAASVNAENSMKKSKKKRSSVVTAKTIKLKESSKDSINLTLTNGDRVSFPKVIKEWKETSFIMPSMRSLLDLEDYSGISLYKKLEEQRELEDLSRKFGFDVTDAKYLDLYREVAGWLGTRYRRGGMSRKAVDCSGFTNLIYNQVFDKKLPRVSGEIARNVAQTVDKDDLEPGDLVFFSTYGRKHINHVGVYLGSGNFVHASIKKGVTISTLLEGYYSKAWRKGGRID